MEPPRREEGGKVREEKKVLGVREEYGCEGREEQEL
jgi:hypothetical protein